MIQKNKLRVEEIEKKISDILDVLEIINMNLPQKFDYFIAMGLAKDGLYKKTEFAIESIIDICNIINSDLRLGFPETEDSLIDNLDGKGVFRKSTIEIIRQMKGFRNILVHKCGDVDDKKDYEDIKEGLKDFETVVKEIEKFLEKQKK